MARRYEEVAPSPDLEERIYDGFPDDGDVQLMVAFQHADWPARKEICLELADERFREFGLRVIYFERPDFVPENERARFDAFVVQRLTAVQKVLWTTVPKALNEIEDLRKNADQPASRHLDEIKEYLLSLGGKRD